MAVAKLALLAVGFRSGFLGGPTFPLIFASTSVALALNLAFPGVPVAIFVAGIMTGAVYALFRTPLMVVLLTGFMLDEGTTMVALIVLAVAIVMIVMPPLQKLMAARRAREGRGQDSGRDVDAPGLRARMEAPGPRGQCDPLSLVSCARPTARGRPRRSGAAGGAGSRAPPLPPPDSPSCGWRTSGGRRRPAELRKGRGAPR